MASCLGHPIPDDLEFVRSSSYDRCLSVVRSSWRIEDTDIAFISEADTIFTFRRGFKNFAKNIMLANDEYDFVAVEYRDRRSYEQFAAYQERVIELRKNAIVCYGSIDHDVIPR